MKAVKATYANGQITLAETPPEDGPVEVLVVFPDPADDPWQQILSDPAERPVLSQWVREVEAEIASGKASPLGFDQL